MHFISTIFIAKKTVKQKKTVGRICRMINYFQDYETCVKRGDKECTYVDGDERDDFGQLTEFFCGQDDECT